MESEGLWLLCNICVLAVINLTSYKLACLFPQSIFFPKNIVQWLRPLLYNKSLSYQPCALKRPLLLSPFTTTWPVGPLIPRFMGSSHQGVIKVQSKLRHFSQIKNAFKYIHSSHIPSISLNTFLEYLLVYVCRELAVLETYQKLSKHLGNNNKFGD